MLPPSGADSARQALLEEVLGDYMQRLDRGEEAERLSQALTALPDDQREAVRLRHLEGWALADVARHLGRTPAATAGLIKRGMQALRRQMHRGEKKE